MGLFTDIAQQNSETKKTSSSGLFARIAEEKEANKKKPSFVGGIIRDIVKPVARLGTNLVNSGQLATGNEVTQPFSGDYLGEVRSVGQSGNFAEDIKDSIGVGLQVASNLPLTKSAGLAFNAMKDIVKSGGLQALKPVAKTLAKEGALYGGSAGLGKGLEEQKSVGESLGQGALGATIGAVANPILGLGVPALTKGAITAKNIIKPDNKFIDNSIKELEDKYIQWSTGTKPGKKLVNNLLKKNEILNKSGTTGKTPMRTLAESGIVPETKGVKFDTFSQSENYRNQINPLRSANRDALKEAGLSTVPSKLDDLESKAISYARTKENINSGRASKMEQEIKNEFSILKKEYPNGQIPLSLQDDIKSARWDNVFKNKGLIDSDVLKKDSEYAIAKAFQKNIEEVAEQAGHKEVAQLNREIGDRLEAAKFLESLDGKVLKGGRVGKYVGTLIGSSLGQTVPGKIIGAVGGNYMADLLIKSSVQSPIRRSILRNLKSNNPEAYQATVKWLEQQDTLRNNRLQLSAPKNTGPIINQGRPIPVLQGGNKEYVGKETTAGGY